MYHENKNYKTPGFVSAEGPDTKFVSQNGFVSDGCAGIWRHKKKTRKLGANYLNRYVSRLCIPPLQTVLCWHNIFVYFRTIAGECEAMHCGPPGEVRKVVLYGGRQAVVIEYVY